jgi:hypothetical protein
LKGWLALSGSAGPYCFRKRFGGFRDPAVLPLMRIDQSKLSGRDYRLADVRGNVLHESIA